jgi:hypothetical protein
MSETYQREWIQKAEANPVFIAEYIATQQDREPLNR